MAKLTLNTLLMKHKTFFVLLLVGLILRLLFIENQGLSNDELSAVIRTRYSSWDELWSLGIREGDMHPGFYQTFLWFWVKLFGESEFAIRSTSLIFYVLNLGLLYAICLRFYSKFTGLVLVAFYVSLSFLIINTTTARPYNSGVFFVLLAFYSLLSIDSEEGKGKAYTWVLFSLSLLGAMASHYFAFLTVGVIGILSFFFLSKQKIIGLVASGMAALLLFTLHLPTTIHQLQQGGIGWLDKPDFFWWIEFLKQSFQDSYWMLAIALLIIITLKNGSIPVSRNQKFAIQITLITGLLAYLISIFYTPILRELVFQFILPFLLIGILGSIEINTERRSGRWKRIAPLLILVLFSCHSIIQVQIYKPKHYGVFRELGENQNKWVSERKSKNICFAENFNNVDYLNYYLDSAVVEEITDWANIDAVYKLNERVKAAKTAYFIYNWSNNYQSPMFLECIRRCYPRIAEFDTYFNSGSYLFSRTIRDNAISKREINEVFEGGLIEGDEFFGEYKINVGDLRNEITLNEYLLLESNAIVNGIKSFYMVVTAERNGEFLQVDSIPAMYYAYNQIELSNEPGMNEFFMAFELPKKLKDNDVVKIYCWNPEKGEIIINNMKLFAVKF